MFKTIIYLTTLLALVSACPGRSAPSGSLSPTTIQEPLDDPSNVVSLKVPVTTQSVSSEGTGYEALKRNDRTSLDPPAPTGATSSRADAAGPVAAAQADALPITSNCPGPGEYGMADTEDEKAALDVCVKRFAACCDVACKSAGYGDDLYEPVCIIPEEDEKLFDLAASVESTYCGCYCEPKLVNPNG